MNDVVPWYGQYRHATVERETEVSDFVKKKDFLKLLVNSVFEISSLCIVARMRVPCMT